MNPGIVPNQPQSGKNQVGRGGCSGAQPGASPPQDEKAGRDQPDARDAGQYLLTGNISQGFDRLMRGIEVTPCDIENAGESSAQAIEPDSCFHLFDLPLSRAARSWSSVTRRAF